MLAVTAPRGARRWPPGKTRGKSRRSVVAEAARLVTTVVTVVRPARLDLGLPSGRQHEVAEQEHWVDQEDPFVHGTIVPEARRRPQRTWTQPGSVAVVLPARSE